MHFFQSAERSQQNLQSDGTDGKVSTECCETEVSVINQKL